MNGQCEDYARCIPARRELRIVFTGQRVPVRGPRTTTRPLTLWGSITPLGLVSLPAGIIAEWSFRSSICSYAAFWAA